MEPTIEQEIKDFKACKELLKEVTERLIQGSMELENLVNGKGNGRGNVSTKYGGNLAETEETFGCSISGISSNGE